MDFRSLLNIIMENSQPVTRLGGFVVQPLTNLGTVDEAIKLDAPHTRLDVDTMQDYLTRIKTGTKLKTDKYKFGYIHSSNIRAIAKSDKTDSEGNYVDVWDLDDLARQITIPPTSILGTNAKMKKSTVRGDIIYDLTLPALHSIVVDEQTGDFVNINTCPYAGACQVDCYALKGGYVMFPASSMSSARNLNFLVNHPDKFMQLLDKEIQMYKVKADKKNYNFFVRWHDAGDFFSKKYLDEAFKVARKHPDVEFYAYTKSIKAAKDTDSPPNWEWTFSQQGQEKTTTIKDSFIVPKNLFVDLLPKKDNKVIKDENGKTIWGRYDEKTGEIVDTEKNINTLKQRLQKEYPVKDKDGIISQRPLDTIITYDEMLSIPKGTERKWSVIVPPSGAGDLAATRKDVLTSFLAFH